MGSSQAVPVSWATGNWFVLLGQSGLSRTEPSSTRYFFLLDTFLIWFEIVLDWEDFIFIFIKRTVKDWYRVISAPQRLSFIYIKLAHCMMLVPTNQALWCLMPNAVLAVCFPSYSMWGEVTAQKILCAVWELPCVGQETRSWGQA